MSMLRRIPASQYSIFLLRHARSRRTEPVGRALLFQPSSPQMIRATAKYLSFSSTSERKKENNDLVPIHDTHSDIVPIDFNVSSEIKGEESQIVAVSLEEGQVLRAESGAMLYMTSGVQMNTNTESMSSGFKRFMTGQNVFVSDFTYTAPSEGNSSKKGEVGLGTDFPSKIIKLNLNEYGGKLVCQRGAFLASNPSVEMEMEFTKKLTTGFFGGEGFILQALVGEGDVFLKAGGTLVKRELKDGETLRVSSGSLVAFAPTVQYDVQTVSGFKNVMFGGEGLFMTTLTGPGTVWLQGMPPDRMISEIARRVPGRGLGFGIPIGMGGSGGDESGEEASDGDSADGVADGMESPEDMVAATDAAVNADRQATVASSAAMSDDAQSIDPESSEALFGDAAGAPSTSSSGTPASGDDFGSSDVASSSETTFSDDSFPEMEESTSFSSSDETDFGAQDFSDDTSFTTFDDSSSSSGSNDAFDGAGGAGDDDEGGFGSILKSVWDFFTDD